MKTIGCIGHGFVGSAVVEGLKHAFEILVRDLKYRNKVLVFNQSTVEEQEFSAEEADRSMLMRADGPIFVCLPTPMLPDGSCFTGIVEAAVMQMDLLASQQNINPVLVIKSTIPPGTVAKLNAQCKNVVCCFNPEFLREVTAIEDFKNQDRIIIGGPDNAVQIVKQMYNRAYPDVPVIKTSSDVAEMVKNVTNSFLATKVAFANEVKQICDKLGIDYDRVVEYATKDKRLGTSHWSVPGPDGRLGFGGKCFCKDLNSVMFVAKSMGVDPTIMAAAWNKNLEVRPERDWEKIPGVIEK
jgi:UDPglucose 6-dehydrogenase